MKTFGQYFKYHFKSTFLRFVIMMAIVLTVSFINMEAIVNLRHGYIKVQNGLGFYVSDPSQYIIEASKVRLGVYTTIFAALCTLMPIFELYSFRSRRNLDTMFTLPVSRTKMLFAHLLNGWIHVTVAFAAEAVIIFSALHQEKDWVNESYIFGYYFALLSVGLAVYLFFSFIFLQGNTIIDGIVFMGAWSFAFMLPFLPAIEIIYRLTNYNNYHLLRSWLNLIGESVIVYSPMDRITTIFNSKMQIDTDYRELSYHPDQLNRYKIEANIGAAFGVVIGIICLVLLYFTFKKQRVEKVEDISTSPIGYKFLIPFYVISIILWEYDPLVVAVGVIAMLVAYIVYRRTFRIKKWDIIMIGITILIGIGVGIAQYVIESNRTVEAGVYLCENVFQYISL